MTKQILDIELFKPHTGQRALINIIKHPQTQYVVMPCGRRWGKTELALNLMVETACSKMNQKILYCTYKGDQRDTVMSDFIEKFGDSPLIKTISRSHFKITFNVTGSVIYFRLGSLPAAEGLRGKKFDLMILDEFALYNKDVWEVIIQPTLATQKQFKCIFMSTTRGRGTFYKLFQFGLDPMRPNWVSYTASSGDNPFVDPNWLIDTKSQISENVYKQEYDAEFIDDIGNLFENIEGSRSDVVHKYNSNKKYYAGIDLGFKEDYCVINIIDESGNVVYYERFNQIPIFDASKKFTDVLRQWNWPVAFIENNQYQGVFEKMKELQCRNIYEFNTNTKSKKEIIEGLITVFEEGTISIPNDDYYCSELYNFGYKYNPRTRNISYEALEGHDDITMSLAIAFNAKKTKSGKMSISFA